MKWFYLMTAIGAEIIATSALKASDGFSRPWPVVVTLVGYSISFYFLSQALRFIPVGVAYAIWSGVGVVLISIIGAVFFKQPLDTPAMLGIGLIISGVLVLNLFSHAVPH
jgi:small multidrug resistance pump